MTVAPPAPSRPVSVADMRALARRLVDGGYSTDRNTKEKTPAPIRFTRILAQELPVMERIERLVMFIEADARFARAFSDFERGEA